jgi:hypothetical protein
MRSAGAQQRKSGRLTHRDLQISKNLKNLPLLRALVQMMDCLVRSPHLHIEPYVRRCPPLH